MKAAAYITDTLTIFAAVLTGIALILTIVALVGHQFGSHMSYSAPALFNSFALVTIATSAAISSASSLPNRPRVALNVAFVCLAVFVLIVIAFITTGATGQTD